MMNLTTFLLNEFVELTLHEIVFIFLIYRTGIEAIYDISYLWAKCGGIILTTLVAIIISLVMGKLIMLSFL